MHSVKFIFEGYPSDFQIDSLKDFFVNQKLHFLPFHKTLKSNDSRCL